MFTQRELEEKFGFHKQTELSTRQHHAVRAAYLTFAEVLDRLLPDGEEKMIAFVDLESSAMWCHKAIAKTAPLAPLPSEYKPLVVDETLIDLLSRKIDMSEFIADGTLTELEASRLAMLPNIVEGKDPEPVFVEFSCSEMDLAEDGYVNKHIKKLVEDNPQFTRPHVSIEDRGLARDHIRIILSQGPLMQEMPAKVDSNDS